MNRADAGCGARRARWRWGGRECGFHARAADHFLDRESNEDRETGSWLIATASSLAQKLAAELDDNVLPQRRPLVDKSALGPHDAGLARRVAAATAPLYGAA